MEECHKSIDRGFGKPERKLVLRIIDAQDSIREQTSLDSFIAGFELAWRLSAEVHNDEKQERSFSWRPRRRAPVSPLRRTGMKNQIAIAAAITASFALWAAVLPQTAVDKEAPAVIATLAPLPEPPEPAMPLTTEMEKVDGMIAEPVLEEAERTVACAPAENQAESAQKPLAPLKPEIEAIGDYSEDNALCTWLRLD